MVQICKNCIKSKRECAGYNQPLVYKQQHPSQNSSVAADTRARINQRGAREVLDLNQQNNASQAQAQTRPSTGATNFQSVPPVHSQSSSWAYPPLPTSQILAEQLQWPREINWSESEKAKFPGELQINTQIPPFSYPEQTQFQFVPYQSGRRPSEAFTEGTTSTGPASASRSTGSTPWARHPSATDTSIFTPSTRVNSGDQPKAADTAHGAEGLQKHSLESHRKSTTGVEGVQPSQYSSLGFLQRRGTSQHDPSVVMPDAQIRTWQSTDFEMEDEMDDPEDPWDIEIDDIHDENEKSAVKDTVDLLQHKAARGYNGRAVTPHRKQSLVSPILDDRYSQTFGHFVSYLVPCISIFERPPSLDMNGLARTTWGYSLPSAALARPALAHAILALSSLHVATLQGTGDGPPMKHFTYALRRLGQLLAMPNRRHETATLATVLLLGFYEVVDADHSRWIMHLGGAGSFLLENDFAGMMRTVRRMRKRARNNIEQPWVQSHAPLSSHDYVRIADIPEALLHDEDWDVDAGFISNLTGLRVDYEQQLPPDFQGASAAHELTEKEVEDWKIKMDLYWWYCKQDIFHSMLSGDPLLLPFEQWKYCPPRGPIGNAEMAHATTDHLWLILARLTNFGGKDLKRKQRVVALQGGQWKPPPGFLGPMPPTPPAGSSKGPSGPPDRIVDQAAQSHNSSTRTDAKVEAPPSANEGRARMSKASVPPLQKSAAPPPMFHGMMPQTKETPQMHSSFHVMEAYLNSDARRRDSQSTVSSTSSTSSTLEADTTNALAEHARISKAFDLWMKSLGQAFEPLPETPETTVRTPFGPALRYRSPIIACTWAFYYTGRILLRRLHPHSPPAAMVSAGVNAQFTRDYAQLIGRIVGGLHAVYENRNQITCLDSTAIAALQETTFPMMFAGVQYQDTGQRGWTINKLKIVAEETGWKSSAAIASACETTWHAMGRMGKGPPYERTLDKQNPDARLHRDILAERARSTAVTNNNLEKEHESQYVSHDRNLIDRHGSTRAYWALGVLSLEDDVEKMTLNS